MTPRAVFRAGDDGVLVAPIKAAQRPRAGDPGRDHAVGSL